MEEIPEALVVHSSVASQYPYDKPPPSYEVRYVPSQIYFKSRQIYISDNNKKKKFIKLKFFVFKTEDSK